MFGKRRSYAEAVQGRRRTARRLLLVLLVFVCYQLVSGLFLGTYRIESQSMSPTVAPGDRILASPLAFGPRTLLGKLPGVAKPARGDLVIAVPNYAKPLGFWGILTDSFVRFVTFQLVSPARGGSDGILPAPTLQRVIALPGDRVRMDDFVFKVEPAGQDQFLTEFELSSRAYDISHADPPLAWRADLPGSGHMDELTLGPGEYFLAGDARSSSSDSRLWGPVRLDRFEGKVLLRYWPPKRLGAL
jgi:signal peptidase I